MFTMNDILQLGQMVLRARLEGRTVVYIHNDEEQLTVLTQTSLPWAQSPSEPVLFDLADVYATLEAGIDIGRKQAEAEIEARVTAAFNDGVSVGQRRAEAEIEARVVSAIRSNRAADHPTEATAEASMKQVLDEELVKVVGDDPPSQDGNPPNQGDGESANDTSAGSDMEHQDDEDGPAPDPDASYNAGPDPDDAVANPGPLCMKGKIRFVFGNLAAQIRFKIKIWETEA